ncbi:MAG: dihydrodipicolinate synthase family protein [Eubacteriales bacterium]
MSRIEKYKGIFPAFYACYEEDGTVSPERVRALTQFYLDKKVKGLYVGGSSGECIYQTVEERKIILNNVMEVAKGKLTIIAHVACNNTMDSEALAKHAQEVGVDAIASIPPIYFKLPEDSILAYWNDISDAAPNTDFIIYNIPQLTGVNLSEGMYRKMMENKRVVGIKNTSMPAVDMEVFKYIGGSEQVLFNGPDEQFVAGRAIGADGGIGGTYGIMPELYIKMDEYINANDFVKAKEMQVDVNRIIFKLCSNGNMYAIAKEVMKKRGLNIGTTRKPMPGTTSIDKEAIEFCTKAIEDAIAKYC